MGQLALFNDPIRIRRTQGGEASSDVVLSAHIGGNADIFPQILNLHVPKGAKVADVTWGLGVFWKKVPKGDYEVHGTDLKTGVDCRKLPAVHGGVLPTRQRTPRRGGNALRVQECVLEWSCNGGRRPEMACGRREFVCSRRERNRTSAQI